MTDHFDFNRICAIAAAVEDLSKDRDTPIYVDGDLVTEAEGGKAQFTDLADGEAARIVVTTVLNHPYVVEELARADKVWEALKWLVQHAQSVPLPPEEHQPWIDAAIDAYNVANRETLA